MTVNDLLRVVQRAQLLGEGHKEVRLKVGQKWYAVVAAEVHTDNAVLVVKEL